MKQNDRIYISMLFTFLFFIGFLLFYSDTINATGNAVVHLNRSSATTEGSMPSIVPPELIPAGLKDDAKATELSGSAIKSIKPEADYLILFGIPVLASLFLIISYTVFLKTKRKNILKDKENRKVFLSFLLLLAVMLTILWFFYSLLI